MDPCKFGWMKMDGILMPLWYDGSNLPSDEIYEEHIKKTTIIDQSDPTSYDTSDTESDSDENNPLSDNSDIDFDYEDVE